MACASTQGVARESVAQLRDRASLLRQRLGAAYRPEDHLGGALYLFMRGLDGTWMQHLPIPSALLDALEALITAPAEACA